MTKQNDTKPMDASFVPYRLAAAYLLDRLRAAAPTLGFSTPLIGIICGSGLSGLSKAMDSPTLTIAYQDIPGFPKQCGVQGHVGEIVFGNLGGVPTMCFRGRFHSYEGHDMKVRTSINNL